MQYLLLIHDNVTSPTTDAEWADFIARAKDSGMFRGGSELGARETIGTGARVPASAHIGGFMRFEADDREKLLELLRSHGSSSNIGDMGLRTSHHVPYDVRTDTTRIPHPPV